ncbi:MAG: LemA family protein [Bacteroidaceae bacterium]|nr:LemA family protein [Bacteroidaceae bacterium]
MELTVIGIIVLVVLAYFVSTQRALVNCDEMCKNALSQIEVQLNSRWDALLALAKTAVQYSKHESETLIDVIQQRMGAKMDTPAAINEQQSAMDQIVGRLIAIGEAYPELKAADLYKEAMGGVNRYEELVRMSRMTYNDTATKMNRMVRQWPSSIVASVLHFTEQEYLKADDDKKKEYPNLDEAFKK